MTKLDDIYEATADTRGMITSQEARELGISNNELVQFAHRGKLTRLGQGLYRVEWYSPTEEDPYAEAVALAGPDAFLWGESVLGLLKLAPTNPAYIQVATTRRVRRTLPPHIRLTHVEEGAPVTSYVGIPSQPAADAIRSCMGHMMPERLAEAVDEAKRLGHITPAEADDLLSDLGAACQDIVFI
ncbi:MAG: type IV toxin-antitoxin system AbiEi family antitoxin domain-containing protein [Atopobiaceae bacterium]|jgi:predicted transcriptional regulator of viral defense system|nr:type IV toxin-antitoxin system AbiEi family antitoxin domain-containing protein [Atopobiaceae bacterium]MDD3176834.1 type IV toxin-antitoxin system AbiEi family antitoxin domain-containing protein [Atopobiaceae bacterium]MDD3485254.1 type IV toxin-antitoxin system AbiEi family antitoxin domain-containing protein [Atopobiaceae bacterium]MDD4380921.1 type IV toxin-antitoxin system AbiEi family antitoxin domain-containing protein [Atopobiaceae bacterium]